MKWVITAWLVHACLWGIEGHPIVSSTKQIRFEKYPGAHNPSILSTKHGTLFCFRYLPDPVNEFLTSYIGIVILDKNLDPITEPEILKPRLENSKTPSQAEDARLFTYRDRIFVIYNDNVDSTSYFDRRDMYIAELFYENGHFYLTTPLKLIHATKFHTQIKQKNWVPFVWNNELQMTYSISPHEILRPNLIEGECYPAYETSSTLAWDLGVLRPSTPPLFIDGEYLAFFHSGTPMRSEVSGGSDLWHYFMGAYTFSAEPPFKITQITPLPIVGKEFYTSSDYFKRVIFPGGFVINGNHLYVAYGKDDCEMWIATIDKTALKKVMIPVK